MPMWILQCPPDAYSDDDKAAFAERITDLYAAFGLPRFYVTVIFQEQAGALYIGGKLAKDFIRVWIDQIARRVPEGIEQAWMTQVNETLKPFIEDRGFRWEVHIDETPFALWSIQGLFPPPAGSDAEKQWAVDDHASPYDLGT